MVATSTHALQQCNEEDGSPFPFAIGQILGTGAYAEVRLCWKSDRYMAVKFLHLPDYINNNDTNDPISKSRLQLLAREFQLHRAIGKHRNIIEFYGTAEVYPWRWIAMEYAEGGDLFDKIEPDVGVGEIIAQFYFSQLVNGTLHMHSKGLAHRDIKPENVLLDGDGNLKISDFGFASLVSYKGKTRLCSMVAGSPPYVAPEVLGCQPYNGLLSDVWSCGIVLFVLLLGNTPWEAPNEKSYEYHQYLHDKSYPYTDFHWKRLSKQCRVNPSARINLEQAKNHPWVCRKNCYLSPSDGLCAASVDLATELIGKLEVDFDMADKVNATLHIERTELAKHYAFVSSAHDFTNISARHMVSSSQPIYQLSEQSKETESGLAMLEMEPSMNQFSKTGAIVSTLTQNASLFRDICPQTRLTRFYSLYPVALIEQRIQEALAVQSIPTSYVANKFKIIYMDRRKCELRGDVEIATFKGDVRTVVFFRKKGDPLEWRRFFKVCPSDINNYN